MKLNPKLKNELKKFLLDKLRSDRKKICIYSSINLTNEQKKLLQAKFKNISFQDAQFFIDKSILGGIIITIGSKIIDLSVKGKLLNLKNILYENN